MGRKQRDEGLETGLMPMNEHEKFFELHTTLYPKRNDESLYFTIRVSLNSKAKVKSQEKPDIS